MICMSSEDEEEGEGEESEIIAADEEGEEEK